MFNNPIVIGLIVLVAISVILISLRSILMAKSHGATQEPESQPQAQDKPTPGSSASLPAQTAPSADAPLLPSGIPARIGEYVVERYLGKGGCADVVFARDREQRPVAVKILRAEYMGTSMFEKFQSLLVREHTAMYDIWAYIVKHQMGEALLPQPFKYGELSRDKRPYIAMEYLEGGRLANLLTGAPLSDHNIYIVMSRVLLVLNAVHRAGYCHLDLKPQNIVVWTRDNLVTGIKLIDFGSAIPYRNSVQWLAQQDLKAMTPPYAPPEMVQVDSYVAPASDLYSLGVILVDMARGALSKANVPPTMPPDAPEWQRRLAEELLKTDPRQRPRDASAAYKLLESFTAQTGVPTGG